MTTRFWALLALLIAVPARASALQDELDKLLRDPSLRGAKVGLSVVDLESGDTVYAQHADDGFNPASTMKVLTSAAALHHLGPSYRFSTTVYSNAPIDAAGVLKGNLYVQGHADPTLVVEKLWKLVYDLKLEGLTEVRGDVVFDEGFLTTDYELPGWDKEKDEEEGPSYFPALSALSLNFNTVAILLAPGSEVGKEARVRLETPAPTYVTIDSKVTTGSAGSRRWFDVEREITTEGVTFHVTGSVPSGGDLVREYRAVPDPTAHFIAAFRAMLEAQSVKVTGKYKRGSVPAAGRRLAELESPPLPAILMDMNKYSNNFMAELVLRTLGAEVSGVPGSTEKGLDAIRSYLDAAGVAHAGLDIRNGSGLARQTEVSPALLASVLAAMHDDAAVGAEFHTSLAIGGLDGTLVRRLTDAPGKLRGKTGTIDGVHCLAGYVLGPGDRMYAFAFMVNDIAGSISRVRHVHDEFARTLMDAGSEPEAEPPVVPGG